MRRAVSRIVMFALMQVSLQGLAASRLEIEPAWNGTFRSGSATEIMVRLGAEQDRASTRPYDLAVVDLQAPSTVYQRQGLTPGARVDIPVMRASGGRLLFTVTRAGSHPETFSSRLHPAPAGTRLVAIAGSIPDLPRTANATLIYVPARTLPRYAASFRTIDLLAIDSAAYDGLSNAQRRALSRYIRGCGGIVLYRFDPGAAKALHDVAGCSGEAVHAAATPREVISVVSGWKPIHPALPVTGELVSLLDTHATSTRRMVLGLLAIYLALMCTLAFRRVGIAPLLLTPAMVAAVILLSWTGTTNATGYRVTWTDTISGSTSANYNSLLRIPGRNLGTARFMVQAGDGLPLPFGGHPALHVDHKAGGVLSYAVKTRLLTPADFEAGGSIQVAPGLQLVMRDDGPVVVNPLDVPSAEAAFAFDDQKYRLPSLPPGGSWRPTKDDLRSWNGTPIDRLFRARSLSAQAALLVPIRDPGPFATLGAGNSLMMVRL